MSSVLNKMKGFFGLDDEYEDEFEDELEEDIEEEVEEVEPIFTGRRQGKVVNLHNASPKSSSTRVLILKPTDFEEAINICDSLKDRRIIVVNTTSLEPKVAQRLLDFMGGASYALGGELQEADRGVYVLSPANIEVTNELKTELSSKGIFGWK